MFMYRKIPLTLVVTIHNEYLIFLQMPDYGKMYEK